MSFVLDSSAVLALLLPDEQSASADAIAEHLLHSAAQVPAIWPLEVRNALLTAWRARRLSATEFDERVSLLDELPIDVDHGSRPEVLTRIVDIARRHGLSAYDASYLELAKRHGIALATLDGKLRKACSRFKVPLLP
jgi:predicted nucleic acid-binding protein